MFSIFKKQEKPEICDNVYMTRIGKYKGLYAKLKEKYTTVLVYYFKDSWKECKMVLDGAGLSYNDLSQTAFEMGKINCISAEQLMHYTEDISKAYILFVEHFPSYTKETELLQHLYGTWKVRSIDFFESVEEPLFMLFGGEQIIGMMKKMGMKEEESLSSKMISQSIVRAQQKIDETLHSEIKADSMQEWLRLNAMR